MSNRFVSNKNIAAKIASLFIVGFLPLGIPAAYAQTATEQAAGRSPAAIFTFFCFWE